MSASINSLNASVPTVAAQFPFYDPTCGQDRRCSGSDIVTMVLTGLTSSPTLQTQYAQPIASAFNVPITPPQAGQNVFLILTPLAAYAVGSVTLPPVSLAVDKQEVLLFSTQAVPTFSMPGNGAQAVLGVPNSLGQFGFVRVRFDAPTASWYCIGN